MIIQQAISSRKPFKRSLWTKYLYIEGTVLLDIFEEGQSKLSKVLLGGQMLTVDDIMATDWEVKGENNQ